MTDCILCRGPEGDDELGRVQVWEDPLWRLTTVRDGEVPGFSYLEPKRHIPHLADLDGEESRTFGGVLACACRALRDAASAEVVYVYVFGGGIPHLHLHLAPHRSGEALSSSMIRGATTETHLPSGATIISSRDFPPLPRSEHDAIRDRIAQLLREDPEPH